MAVDFFDISKNAYPVDLDKILTFKIVQNSFTFDVSTNKVDFSEKNLNLEQCNIEYVR